MTRRHWCPTVAAIAVVSLGCSSGDNIGPSGGSVVGPAGGTIEEARGNVSLTFPPGAVAQDVTVTIQPASTFPVGPVVVPGSVYQFGPDGMQFGQPIQLVIKYQPAALPAGIDETSFRLFKIADDGWEEVPGSTVSTGAHAVMASLNSFSTYGILAQALLTSDASIQIANINQSVRPGSFELKKTLRFTLVAPAEVFVTYDLGQSHGCCDDHQAGALRIRLDGRELIADGVPFRNYGVFRFLEDFDYFWSTEVVKGLTAPFSNPNCPVCQPPIQGPRLDNYKVRSLVSQGVTAAGQHVAELLLGDAGWNSRFEVSGSSSVSPSPSLVINPGLFINNAPIDWSAAPTTVKGDRAVTRTAGGTITPNGITVVGPTGKLFSATPDGWTSRYMFIGSSNHLLLLDSEVGPGTITRVVSVVDFKMSPPSKATLPRVSSTSTRAAPNVQYSQGTGDAFFIFTPVPSLFDPEKTEAAQLEIRRSDNGQSLCLGPTPYSPTGQLVAEATATQLLIKDGGQILATCNKPT